MFTGIIEDLAEIEDLMKFNDYWKISIFLNFENVNIGDSISVNGVCLTVENIKKNLFYFDVIKETLNITNLKFLKISDVVNIERCLKLNDRIDGHIVQGHIECLGELLLKETNDGETKIRIKLDDKYIKYCIYKGSIAIDGISLTISDINDDYIECSIIPHTLKNTTLGVKNVGEWVNVETDMIAKYVEKQLNSKKIKA